MLIYRLFGFLSLVSNAVVEIAGVYLVSGYFRAGMSWEKVRGRRVVVRIALAAIVVLFLNSLLLGVHFSETWFMLTGGTPLALVCDAGVIAFVFIMIYKGAHSAKNPYLPLIVMYDGKAEVVTVLAVVFSWVFLLSSLFSWIYFGNPQYNTIRLLALLLVVFFLVVFLRRADRLAGISGIGVEVKAVLRDIRMATGGMKPRGLDQYRCFFAYAYGGKEYEFKCNMFPGEFFDVGAEISLLVNPQDPSDAVRKYPSEE